MFALPYEWEFWSKFYRLEFFFFLKEFFFYVYNFFTATYGRLKNQIFKKYF
jgi:hypothetical protein